MNENDIERRTREEIAERIFDEEQRCQEAIISDPTNPHLSGRLMGLQRARDIAVGGY